MIALLLGLALAQERVDRVVLTGVEPAYGNPDSQWTIVQFSDWMCPHCARGFDHMGEVAAADPKLRVVFKVYPLTGECNAAVHASNGATRCDLADVAACAHAQGRWKAFAEWAFGNQGDLGHASRQELVVRSGALGLDVVALETCLKDGTGRRAVEADAAEGARLGLEGTPTFFVRDPARGDWIRSDGGAEGAVTLLRSLRDGVVERP